MIKAEKFFRDYASSKIIARGYDYYESGAVVHIDNYSSTEYQAVVLGSEEYSVNLSFNYEEGTLESWGCDCPYDGNMCKHVVASIYEVCDSREFERNMHAKKGVASESAKAVAEILEKVTFDAFKEFLLKQLRSDNYLKENLIDTFSYLLNDLPEKYFMTQVNGIVESFSDNTGSFSNTKSAAAFKKIKDLIKGYQNESEGKNRKNSYRVCFAVLEMTLRQYRFFPQDSIHHKNMIAYCLDLLRKFSKKNNYDDEYRKELFSSFLNLFAVLEIQDNDSYRASLGLAADLVKSTDEADLLIAILEKSNYFGMTRELQHETQYDLIMKLKGEKAAGEFFNNLRDNQDLRSTLIKRNIENRQYDKALQLAEEGIARLSPINYYQLNILNDLILDIAVQKKDTNKIIAVALEQIKSNGFRGKKDYFALLKKSINPDDWNNFLDKLTDSLMVSKANYKLVAEIYIRQKWWQRLLGHVMLEPSLLHIYLYEKYLAEDYAEEMIIMYEEAILSEIKDFKTRDQYKEACRYIQRINKLGGKTTAFGLIEHLRTEYPKRHALIEELQSLEKLLARK